MQQCVSDVEQIIRHHEEDAHTYDNKELPAATLC